MTKPTLPQGTRDFAADTVRKRQYIINTIRQVFELYGFQPLETPAFENLETLMGKYGEEGDKLIFKILNNGLDNPSKKDAATEAFNNVLEGKSSKALTERALKYDLTIPFARYVAMNHGQLVFPFKRYQVQPVWRADRPQKGRYREFWQCDADVVGSKSLLNEVDFVLIYHEVFNRLGLIDYTLRINHRQLLGALASATAGADKMTDITVAIDKLDKIGLEKVKEELAGKGLDNEHISIIEKYLGIRGSADEKLNQISELLPVDADTGVNDLRQIIAQVQSLNIPVNMEIDFTLARGLNYYTGIIFEAQAPATVKIGSIGGGGRYDDLTGLFGVPNIPGVGISFGLDRIYDVMEELNLFPQAVQQGTTVLFFNMGAAESRKALELTLVLRRNGVAAELYHEQSKLDKQFKYAEKKHIPFVAIVGEAELKEKTVTLKNLSTGEQQSVPFTNVSSYFV